MADPVIQHYLIQELKRVGVALGKDSITIQDYKKEAIIPYDKIEREFGTFTEALKAAGMLKQAKKKKEPVHPEARAHNRLVKTHQVSSELESRFEDEITPYAAKYEREVGDTVSMVYGSDFHSLWMDPFAFHVFLEHCKRMQPDIIGLVGDVADFYPISSFSKDPSRLIKLQSEIDFVCEMIFKPLRDACPDAQIDFFIGNHEWRLFKFLSSQAPGLASLRCLKFNELFRLDDYKINLVAKKSFLSAPSPRKIKNYKCYYGLLVLTHGTSAGQNVAKAEYNKYKKSGANGHNHRHQAWSETDLNGRKEWTSMGCMARTEIGEEYIEDMIGWQQGFECAHIDLKRKKVVKEYIQIEDGFAVAGGVYYRDKSKL